MLSDFLESPSFPSCPSFGFTSEPAYRVTVIEIADGHERRNRHWSRPLYRYTASVNPRHEREVADLIEFWHAVSGMTHGFRFKDYVDYKSCRIYEDAAATDQPLVLITGATYQLTKEYVAGVLTQQRDIIKPVVGTIVIADNGVEKTEGTDYTLDYTTGRVTINFTPAGALTWGGEFDVPVHFSSELPVEITNKNIHSTSFTLQELRNPAGVADAAEDDDDDNIEEEDFDSDTPEPPDSDMDPGVDSGSDTLFFWDFESEDVGPAEAIEGIWRHMKRGDNAYAYREIVATNPLVTGENYYRATLTKNGTRNFRVKRALDFYFGTPVYADETGSSDVGVAMTSLGGGNYVATEDYWFGFKARIDEIEDAIDGIFVQWHTWQGAAPTFSPQISLRAKGGLSPRIAIYVKKNADNNNQTFVVPLFTGSEVIGEAHKYVFQLRWDSRIASAGSIGVYRVWVDDEVSPRFEWVNRSTNRPGDEFVPWFSMGWYKPEYKRIGENGDTNIVCFSHLKIMGGGGSRVEVLPP